MPLSDPQTPRPSVRSVPDRQDSLFNNGASPQAVKTPAGDSVPVSSEASTLQQKRQLLSQLLQQQSPASRPPTPQRLELQPHPDQLFEPFPLTDVQQAYWLGQTGLFGLGNVATHMYTEVDATDLDLERLFAAFDRLVRHHPMLRAVVTPDGTQRILPEVPAFRPRVLDLRELSASESQAELDRVRAELSHQVLAPNRWPLFDGCISLRDERRVRLHISFSLLILDAWSIRRLMAQWALLYQFPQAELPVCEVSFRDYVLFEQARRSGPSYQTARHYWTDRLATLPSAPQLPLACRPEDIDRPRFSRKATTLDAMRWSRIKDRAAKCGFTHSAVLLAAFSDVLRTWSSSSQFTVNLTLFNRLPVHPQISELLGDFTSLTLLTADCSRTESFEDRVRRVQEQLGRDLDHVEMGGIAVLRELWRVHGRDPATVMPVVFTSIVGKSSLPDDMPFGEVVYGITQTPQVWLDHQIIERAGALAYNWDYVAPLFPPGLIDAMFQAYSQFLRRLSEDPEAWQDRERRHLPESQREQRAIVNATQRTLRNVRLESLFDEQRIQRPEAWAVVTSDRRLTYAELGAYADRIARQLREQQVAPNSLVAVIMDKGWEQVPAVLGILQAGAAYLPIDPTLPMERIRYLLSNAEVKVALTQPQWRSAEFWPDDVVRIGVEDAVVEKAADAAVPPTGSTDDLAYVIYTSGSTGQPKGVMISHRAVVNTILDMNERFQVGPTDRVLALSSLSFDLSVYDIFGLLAAGGTIVIPDSAAARDADAWLDQMEREQVTIWNTVPSLLEMVVESAIGRGRAPQSLRRVFLSGDWIPVTLPDRIRTIVPEAEVISLGGATEASIWSIYHRVEHVPADAVSIPYGRPLGNQSWHVLHDDGQPCPVWVPGELFIGGIGLALGYWKDAEKTAARFVRHPQTGERLYRTGDLGRYLPNGDIEFLGRIDTQVKILGHRIELGEIEAALTEHPDIEAAIVCAVGDPRGNRCLVAHVVPVDSALRTGAESTARWTAFLAQKLPHYMIPGEFRVRSAFPLTANGKVDRQALAKESTVSRESSPSHASKPVVMDDLTREVLLIISAEMGLPNLLATDNLMHVGANSIDMIRLANRFETEFGFRPNLPDFFRDPSAQGLISLLRAHRDQPDTVSTSGSSTATSTSSTILLDPAARAAFKQEQRGHRQFVSSTERIMLPELPLDARRQAEFHRRRSQRTFLPRPIPLANWSGFLGNLQQIIQDGHAKYRYGSAGGLYPVQTYVHLKADAVTGIGRGLYYYDPLSHTLVAVAPGVELDREIHQAHINQPVFDQAAFSVFLVGTPAAIEPMYGDLSRHFITLEAGAITQLLEDSAGRYEIGLCQIGWMDFDRIRPLFGLEETQWLVHSLLGGLIEPEPTPLTLPPTEVPESHAATDRPSDFEEGEL